VEETEQRVKEAEGRLFSYDVQIHDLWANDTTWPADLSTPSVTTMMLDVMRLPHNQQLIKERQVGFSRGHR